MDEQVPNLSRRARDALARYQEAVSRQETEEARYQEVRRRYEECARALLEIESSIDETALLDLSKLRAQCNVHGLACNEAIFAAKQAHADLLQILAEAGFASERLADRPTTRRSLH